MTIFLKHIGLPMLHRHFLSRICTILSAGLLISLLSACTIQLVSDYDDQIDSGLSQLNTDVTAFVNKMIGVANTPDGTWDKNKDFYITENAKIATLIAREQAHKVLSSCPSTALVRTALSSELSSSDLQKYSAQIPDDDCSVVLLELIQKAFADLEALHKAQGAAGIPGEAHDPILVGGLGSLIHAAMVVEIAKKGGQTAAATTGGK